MAAHKPRYLIKRECDRASGNLDMCMTHLFTIRGLCKDGKRPDLITMVDKIGEGACAVQTTITGFKAMVDGKIPTTTPKPTE